MKYDQHVLQLAVIVIEVTMVTCEWSPWGQWSKCSVTCGYGVMKRQKTWQAPEQTQSDDNVFRYEDIHECITDRSCPIDGHWNFWGPWGECTEMCDGGVTKRERECNAPQPRHGGKECEGKAVVSATCNDWECPELPPNFDMSACNDTTFICTSRLQCISQQHVCDDSLQCHDGSDEHECSRYHWNNGAGPIKASMIPAILSLILCALVSL